MKKIFAKISEKHYALKKRVKRAIGNVRAEGYIDSGVKILIAVVIGALLLAGLYTLFNSSIMPSVSDRFKELFNFKGQVAIITIN